MVNLVIRVQIPADPLLVAWPIGKVLGCNPSYFGSIPDATFLEELEFIFNLWEDNIFLFLLLFQYAFMMKMVSYDPSKVDFGVRFPVFAFNYNEIY